MFGSGNNQISFCHVDNYCHGLMLGAAALYPGSPALGEYLFSIKECLVDVLILHYLLLLSTLSACCHTVCQYSVCCCTTLMYCFLVHFVHFCFSYSNLTF